MLANIEMSFVLSLNEGQSDHIDFCTCSVDGVMALGLWKCSIFGPPIVF